MALTDWHTVSRHGLVCVVGMHLCSLVITSALSDTVPPIVCRDGLLVQTLNSRYVLRTATPAAHITDGWLVPGSTCRQGSGPAPAP